VGITEATKSIKKTTSGRLGLQQKRREKRKSGQHARDEEVVVVVGIYERMAKAVGKGGNDCGSTTAARGHCYY